MLTAHRRAAPTRSPGPPRESRDSPCRRQAISRRAELAARACWRHVRWRAGGGGSGESAPTGTPVDREAPPDSATRTPIHPPGARRRTAASSQAVPSRMRVSRRCVVAPGARASADIQEREPAVSCADLTAGARRTARLARPSHEAPAAGTLHAIGHRRGRRLERVPPGCPPTLQSVVAGMRHSRRSGAKASEFDIGRSPIRSATQSRRACAGCEANRLAGRQRSQPGSRCQLLGVRTSAMSSAASSSRGRGVIGRSRVAPARRRRLAIVLRCRR